MTTMQQAIEHHRAKREAEREPTWNIAKLGLVVVAYKSDNVWCHYATYSHYGPAPRELVPEWEFCAVTLRSSGHVQIAYRTPGARKWRVAA